MSELLRFYFARATQDQTVEQVFDQLLERIWPFQNPKKTGSGQPPLQTIDAAVEPSDVDVYEKLRLEMGWASDEQLKAQASLQATQIKPSHDLIDWLEGAIKRYYRGLEQARALADKVVKDWHEALRSGDDEAIRKAESALGHDPLMEFFDNYAMSSEVEPDKPLKEPDDDLVREPVHACPVLTRQPVERLVEASYAASVQLAADQKMRTSFTNRLRSIDWNYYLQQD